MQLGQFECWEWGQLGLSLYRTSGRYKAGRIRKTTLATCPIVYYIARPLTHASFSKRHLNCLKGDPSSDPICWLSCRYSVAYLSTCTCRFVQVLLGCCSYRRPRNLHLKAAYSCAGDLLESDDLLTSRQAVFHSALGLVTCSPRRSPFADHKSHVLLISQDSKVPCTPNEMTLTKWL